MATATQKEASEAIVLRGVAFKEYARLAANPANYHLRMTYLDGVLEIVSPKLLRHEVPSVRFLFLVATVANELGLKSMSIGSATFQRGGEKRTLGAGAEPDQGFYIQNHARLRRDRDPDLEAGDPPPDLWIEVDNRGNSARRLPVYARLGVPEIWRYRVKTKRLEFLRLVEDRYDTIESSLALPILSPANVLEMLAVGEALSDQEWIQVVTDRARWLIKDRADTR